MVSLLCVLFFKRAELNLSECLSVVLTNVGRRLRIEERAEEFGLFM